MSLTSLSPGHEIVATILVTDRPFAEQRVIQAYASTKDDAQAKCLAQARAEGWTTPKWWQIWRSADSIAPHASVHN